jgi:SAM-dependent methyltransferase
MTSAERWLAHTWPFVRSQLPAAPARVVEVGCGPLGGFVPELCGAGYEAVGVDPKAPEGEHYDRVELERAQLPERVDAVVASLSLHHVADPAHAIELLAGMVGGGGVVIMIEWNWQRFGRNTAAWCFERLGADDEPGFLHRRRDEWLASGQSWESYLAGWVERERLHAGDELVRLLDKRLERRLFARGPYYFPHLADTSEADELEAIDSGRIEATRIDYVAAAI